MSSSKARCSIAIHGGAGIRRAGLSARDEKQYLSVLKKALQLGHRELKRGASALDAVVAAVVVLEDSPLYNAGKGAVYTTEGTHELDAAIMDGRSLAAGAVASIKRTKNPIKVARLVMEKSRHVLFVGEGADAFAEENGAEMVEPDYFRVEKRWLDLLAARKRSTVALDHELTPDVNASGDKKFGTVGAVALDLFGNLAAATSTGGVTNKMCGRVGDTPVIGAGTYADNATVAVSCTGRGEEFIRNVLSHSLAQRIGLLNESLAVASKKTLALLPDNCGGFIAMNAKGQIVTSFNTEGMFRGSINTKGIIDVRCF